MLQFFVMSLLPFILFIEATVLWDMKFGSVLQVSLYALIMNIFSTIARIIVIDGLLISPLTALLNYLKMLFSISTFIDVSVISELISLDRLLIAVLVEYLVLKRLAPTHPNICRAIIISNVLSYLFVFTFSMTNYLSDYQLS